MDIPFDTTLQPELTPEFLEIIKNDTYNHLKKMRTELLIATDKYLLPDFPIIPDKLDMIKEYRQSLRDFTNNDYVFPTKPDFITLLNG